MMKDNDLKYIIIFFLSLLINVTQINSKNENEPQLCMPIKEFNVYILSLTGFSNVLKFQEEVFTVFEKKNVKKIMIEALNTKKKKKSILKFNEYGHISFFQDIYGERHFFFYKYINFKNADRKHNRYCVFPVEELNIVSSKNGISYDFENNKRYYFECDTLKESISIYFENMGQSEEWRKDPIAVFEYRNNIILKRIDFSFLGYAESINIYDSLGFLEKIQIFVVDENNKREWVDYKNIELDSLSRMLIFDSLPLPEKYVQHNIPGTSDYYLSLFYEYKEDNKLPNKIFIITHSKNIKLNKTTNIHQLLDVYPDKEIFVDDTLCYEYSNKGLPSKITFKNQYRTEEYKLSYEFWEEED